MTMKWSTRFLLSAWVVGVAPAALAQVPSILPVQGVLTNSEGAPLQGNVSVTFSLYDRPVGGTAFFVEQLTVMAEAGAFSAYLGQAGSPALDLAEFNRTEVYLGLTVESDPEMSPRVRLGTAPYAAVAQSAVDANTLGGVDSTGFAREPHTHSLAEVSGVAAAAHGHPFSELTGVPAGLADGDDDTTYSNGTGLDLTGTTFSIDPIETQRRVVGTCNAGFAMRAIGADGSVTCEPDDDTTYTAGAGLSLSGSTLSVDNYASLARKDAAAGNQSFDGNTLVLDYTNNRVGVRNSSPDEELDVGGDVEVTGNYLYASAKTFYKYYGASGFESSSSAFVNIGSYIYPSSTTSIRMYSTVRLPQSATLRTLTCYYYDGGAGDIEDLDIFIQRRATTSISPTTLFSSINDPADITSSVVRSVSASGTHAVNNVNGHYQINVLFDLTAASTASTRQRFYGCRVFYSLDRASTD